MGRKSRVSRGTTAVEFTIICSLFFLFLFGIIDFGYFFFNRHVVTDAAREGARMAILGGVTEGEVKNVISQKLSVLSKAGEANITVSSLQPSQPVTVTVTMPFEFFVLPNLITGLIDINSVSSSVVMVHEP